MIRSLFALLFLTIISCKQQQPATVVEEISLSDTDLTSVGKQKLSDYGFFVGNLKDLNPAERVTEYELNSPLFSDYAFKKRFVFIPEGSQITYNSDDVFDFPNGTVLIKNFYYPSDFRKPTDDIRVIETRLLIKEGDAWKALPYIWNDEQTEAFLEVAGKNLRVSWTHEGGSSQQVLYSVPNMNQCSGCHLRGDKIMPIGPTARQLNGPIRSEDENQLVQWSSNGLLQGLPEMTRVPRLVAYNSDEAPVNLRARAWLEVNCAHCHRPDGPAKTSGLHLLASVTNRAELGIGKAPVAAGRGSGGLLFDIVPGDPEASILYYRIQSSDPGVMMPELGMKLVHKEGVELVRQWIVQLKKDGV
ncbi:MAG: SO2930 family diheme c-type cytochrome [Cyclobacteriaceae bacterium]